MQHILDLTSEDEFDFEFGEGEGDREIGEDAADDDDDDDDWIECKIEEIKSDCNDFEKRLLGAILRPREHIPALSSA